MKKWLDAFIFFFTCLSCFCGGAMFGKIVLQESISIEDIQCIEYKPNHFEIKRKEK